MILVIANLVLLFLLVSALAHWNWFGAIAAVFFIVLLWLWLYRKVDLGYAFRRPRILAFVVIGMAALYIISEVLYGCAAVVTTEQDTPPQPLVPRSELIENAASL